MLHLFSEEGLAAPESFIDRETLFAFDLDGTLVPIVANPEDIRVPDGIRNALVRLTESATVITGRSCDDAFPRSDFPPVTLSATMEPEVSPSWKGPKRKAQAAASGANINIYSEVSGNIIKIPVSEGESVRQGTPLIMIGNSVQRADR
jgi:trehalose 6-phosphate phosphatase